MCRVFGCVAAEPVSIRHELLEAENPLIRQSEDHDSGWGMAVYQRADGDEPRLLRFPQAAYADDEFERATELRGRIFNVHVRRATMGGLTLENTHPFCLGNYSFCHNGTIIALPAAARARHAPRRRATPTPSTFFNFLMRDFDPGDARGLACGGPCRRRSSARRSPGSTSCSPTASACTPTGWASSSCTGWPGPGSCWWPRSG